MSDAEYYGCSDGGCVFGHPGGMHTNGGCKCLYGDLTRDHEKRRRLTKGIAALRAENERLRADLAGLAAAGDETKRVYCARLEEVEDALSEAWALLAVACNVMTGRRGYDDEDSRRGAVENTRAFLVKWGRK